jgi:hypothetical protein
MTNTELVMQYMEFGSPLNQAFVIEALTRYAKKTARNADAVRDSMKGSFIHPDSWIKCAEDWLAAERARAEISKPKDLEPLPRTIADIAKEIRRDWVKPYFGAVPYLDAMRELRDINDDYYADSAHSVVLYFLSNAQTWKGEVARRIKKELKALCDSVK